MNSRLPVASRLAARRSFLHAATAALLGACGGGGLPSAPQPHNRYARIGAFLASQHTASLTPDGGVILVGGSRGGTTLSDSIDRFDPLTGALARVGVLAAGRSSHLATPLPTADVLITGGLLNLGDARAAELIDARTRAVQPAGSMSVPRIVHAAVALADGRVFVCGGFTSGERAPLGISDSAELWDPATRRFRRLTSRMSVRRAGHTATLLPGGRVLIVGGYVGETASGSAEIFDPATESFQLLAQQLPARANHVAHALPDGAVLVLGGETTDPVTSKILPLASVSRFDPRTAMFSAEPPLAAPRTMTVSTSLPGGDVLLFGGEQPGPESTATAERYVPSSGGTALAALDAPRILHSATLLADGRVLIAGGETSGGAYATALLVFD